jgi:hypothetical protein
MDYTMGIKYYILLKQDVSVRHTIVNKAKRGFVQYMLRQRQAQGVS